MFSLRYRSFASVSSSTGTVRLVSREGEVPTSLAPSRKSRRLWPRCRIATLCSTARSSPSTKPASPAFAACNNGGPKIVDRMPIYSGGCRFDSFCSTSCKSTALTSPASPTRSAVGDSLTSPATQDPLFNYQVAGPVSTRRPCSRPPQICSSKALFASISLLPTRPGCVARLDQDAAPQTQRVHHRRLAARRRR